VVSATEAALASALGIDLSAVVTPGAPARSVPHSAELDRVLALPRRDWWRGLGGRFGRADEVRDLLSEYLRLPGSTATLRLVQSAGLQEAADFGGLLAPIVVGGGKTLLAFLLPVVLGAARPVLFVRAALVEKTTLEREDYARDWRVPELALDLASWSPGKMLVVTYEALSLESRATLLWDYRPDLLVPDEAHRLRNLDTGRTRRVARYIADVRAGRVEGTPRVSFCTMTGTLAKRSLRDYAHLAEWALGENTPLPRHRDRLAEWSEAIDEDAGQRVQVGALARLCQTDEEQAELGVSPLLACRRAFGRRLRQTPGVISVDDEYEIPTRLAVRALHLAPDAAQADALMRLRRDWETPGGEPFAGASDLWRHGRELAQGFYYRWAVPAPEEWLAARRDWCRFVREALRSPRARDGRGGRLDTPLQVARACARGYLDRSYYDAWTAVRGSFKPKNEAVWISDAPVVLAADWLARHDRGICWVEHREVGRRLSDMTGMPYYSKRGRDRAGRPVKEARGPIICSIRAIGEGHNLQWYRHGLVMSAPPSGQEWEQMLGRLHREGQDALEVLFEVLLACREALESFLGAVSDAEYLSATTSRQKLATADVQVAAPDPAPRGW
jgi:hypothetical protein